MRLALWHAPALLLLYQTAPIQARFDEVGRFRLALGLSRGGYSNERFDCAGNVTERARVRYTTFGGQADAWVSPRFRISAAAGVIRGESDSAWGNVADGMSGGILVAQEGEKFGIGGGVGLWPRSVGEPAEVVPAFYLRFGRADRPHFRIDDQTSAAPGSPPVVRLGLAGGYGTVLRPRWFVGVHGWPFPREGNVLGFSGEIGLPLGRLQPVVSGGVRPSEGESDWNLGIGLRAALGKRRPGAGTR